jgi:hypothetical protein
MVIPINTPFITKGALSSGGCATSILASTENAGNIRWFHKIVITKYWENKYV